MLRYTSRDIHHFFIHTSVFIGVDITFEALFCDGSHRMCWSVLILAMSTMITLLEILLKFRLVIIDFLGSRAINISFQASYLRGDSTEAFTMTNCCEKFKAVVLIEFYFLITCTYIEHLLVCIFRVLCALSVCSHIVRALPLDPAHTWAPQYLQHAPYILGFILEWVVANCNYH